MDVQLTKIVDKYIGSFLCRGLGALTAPLRAIFPCKVPAQPKKILITRLWALGESLMVLPMIRVLREEYPDAQVDVLVYTRARAVFDRTDLVDNIVEWGPKCLSKIRSYDVVIDTEPALKISALSSWYLGKHVIGFDTKPRRSLYHSTIPFNDQKAEVDLFVDMLIPMGVHGKAKSMVPISFTADEKKGALQKIKGLKKPLIAFCTTSAESGSFIRRWPRESFVKAAKELHKKTKGTIIFIGAPSDIPYVKDMSTQLSPKTALDLTGKTSFGELIALLTHVDVLVSNDTGPMHLGAAQGTKTLGLFGPNLPIRFGPYGKKHASLYHAQHCSPCINVHKAEIDKYNCTNNRCMKAITVKEVVDTTVKLLKK